jgi:hypothetical protein
MKCTLTINTLCSYGNSTLAIYMRAGHICAMTRNRVAAVGYSYAQVEGALGALFGVPATALGSFRGRVRHLQRIGLVEVAPGKGRRISYSPMQANEWMLALYLADLGVDPIVIVKSIRQGRKKLQEWMREATDEDALGGNEVFLAARPVLMSGAWASKDSAGILRFAKFKRYDDALKILWHDSRPPRSGRPALKPAVAPIKTAPPSPGQGAQPATPTRIPDPRGLQVGSPIFEAPELREVRVLDWADPLLLVVNLTKSVRALGHALESAPSD